MNKTNTEHRFSPETYNELYKHLNSEGKSGHFKQEQLIDGINYLKYRTATRNFNDIINGILSVHEIIENESQENDLRLRIIQKLSSFGIVYPLRNESRRVFIENITNLIFEEAKKDINILSKIGLSHENFEIGDEVILNIRANKTYRLTKEGSEGVVEKIENGIIYINFSKLTGDSSLSERIYDIETKYIINNTSIKNGIGETEKELISKYVNYLVIKHIKDNSNINEQDILDILLQEEFLIELGTGEYVLNRETIKSFISPELEKVYGNREIYSVQSVSSLPPAEAQPHVLMLELTQGCNHNNCTYCNLYQGIEYGCKTGKEFIVHTEKVLNEIGNYKRKIRRVFIGSGNSLHAPQDVLLSSLQHVKGKLSPKRIAIYGNSSAIIGKGTDNLRELYDNGLNLIYWGIESGSDEVLKYVKKGSTMDQILKAGKIMDKTRIALSVMIMPGLGGVRYNDEHIIKTAEVLNSFIIKYITFMGISPSENSKYFQIMQEEIKNGTNRHLTDYELVKQMKDILDLLEPKGQKVGIYGPETNTICVNNPVTLNTEFDSSGKRKSITVLEQYLKDNHDNQGQVISVNGNEDSIRQGETPQLDEENEKFSEELKIDDITYETENESGIYKIFRKILEILNFGK
ncbi:MAG: radical SAM protein [Candidatus Gracilibacteria bacterium]|nr:radical SAM protein [Candidatus Gracilibacteria bacterium]